MIQTFSVRGWHGSFAWHDLVPRLLNDHRARFVAEVGVWRGELSARILNECPLVEQLTLVDPWLPQFLFTAENKWYCVGPGADRAEMEDCYKYVQTITEPFGSRVRIFRLPSVKAAELVPDGSLDAVLIDALHFENTVKEDITAWTPKLRKGGVLIGDDYSAYYPGVELGVRAIFGDRHQALGQTWWAFPHGGPEFAR